MYSEREQKEKDDLFVYIFRHGTSQNTQGRVSVSEANDLTEDGINIVIKNAQDLAQKIDRRHPIIIQSSPFGRCIHTAVLIAGVLKEHQFSIVEHNSALIHINENLRHSGFQSEKVLPIIYGGSLDIGGQTISIDPQQTNPRGLEPHTYLFTGQLRFIPEQIRRQWPQSYVDYLESIESTQALTTRMMDTLHSIYTSPYRCAILVTHGSLVGFMTYVYNGQIPELLGPGEVITLQATQEGDFLIKEAGALHPTEKMNGIFTEFDRYFKPKTRPS
jgi:broad specificity phosphatase PhoE